MTHVDSLQAGSAATSITAAAASVVTPHPLQIAVWVIAILAGVYSIYRGFMSDRRAQQALNTNDQSDPA